MYTLYYSPGACSMAVHVLLNELGVDYQTVNVWIDNEKKNKKPEFLKINPRGAVPVLIDGDIVIREGAAIIIYLLDKHQSPLLPRSGKERATALEWLMFANATMHPAYGKAFYLNKRINDKAIKETLFPMFLGDIEKLWQEVDARLADHPYVCGNEPGAADILLTVFANWNSYFPQPIALGENVKRMIRSIIALPSYQKALQSENVVYKAAA